MRIFLSQKGTAAIEFAIVLLLLIFLIFGLIEAGLILYNKQVITNATREGARAGIVAQNPRVNDATIQQVITNYSLNHLITFGTTNMLAISIGRSGDQFGDDLMVRVTYFYTFLIMPKFMPLINPMRLSAQTVMKYE